MRNRRTEAFGRELDVLLPLMRTAALATEQIRNRGIEWMEKEDGTPLTHADIVSQAILLSGMWEHFGEDRIAAEEESHPLPEALRGAACQSLKEVGLKNCEDLLEAWIGFRGNPAGRRTWMIDPIDGTKGFRKGLCYAIAVGLWIEGRPQFGIIAAPAFPLPGRPDPVSLIAFGGVGLGSYSVNAADEGSGPERLFVSRRRRHEELRAVASREHGDQQLISRFVEKAGIRESVRLDSQAKYLLLATDQADVYVRTTSAGYGLGYVWDHCAGQVILEQAGGRVTDFQGSDLDYFGPGYPLLDGVPGLLASNGRCHGELLEIIGSLVEGNR